MTSLTKDNAGPAQVYMSLSDDVKSDDGSGEWFKIQDTLFCSDPGNEGALTDAWCTWGEPGISFTIPETIPDGEYLVRVEHVAIHGAQGSPDGAEYYYACGQLKVEGSTVDSLPDMETISIPGGVQPDDEAVMFNIWTDVSEYPYTVGPALIPGGSTWGSADGSSDTTVVNGGGESSSPSSGSGSSNSSSSESSNSNSQSSSDEESVSTENSNEQQQGNSWGAPSNSDNSQQGQQQDNSWGSDSNSGAPVQSNQQDCEVQYIRRSFRA